MALLGELWPQEWHGDFDPLGVCFVHEPQNRARFEAVTRAALRQAGGRAAPDGCGVLLAREWLLQSAPQPAAPLSNPYAGFE